MDTPVAHHTIPPFSLPKSKPFGAASVARKLDFTFAHNSSVKGGKEKDHEQLNELEYKEYIDIIFSEQFPVRAVTDKAMCDSVMECISILLTC